MDCPLISLCIITYNSSQYIIDTLESAKSQSYKNLELIISDDCSNDDTLEKCAKWIEENGKRFVRTLLLKAPQNRGIPANCNNAIAASKGEWIKILAGDDIFLPNCVEDNWNFVCNNPKAEVVFSVARTFKVKNGAKVYLRQRPKRKHLPYFQMNAENQLKQLYAFCFLPAPTLFIDAAVAKMYRYDERYKYMEDYPQWINLTKNGFKLYFFDKETILYRITDSMSKHVKYFYNSKFMDTKFNFYDSIYEETFKFHPHIAKERIVEKELFFFTNKYLKNRRNLFTRLIRKIVKMYIRATY